MRSLARLLTLLAPIAVVAALLTAVATPAQAVEAGRAPYWSEGRIVQSDVINCWSLIQGTPMGEKGASAWVSQEIDPDDNPPNPNYGTADTDGDGRPDNQFYIKISVKGMGSPCLGGSFFKVGFGLPAGVQLDTNRQIECYYDRQRDTSAKYCPQNLIPNGFGAGTYGYVNNDAAFENQWGVAQGHLWEFAIPVKATATVSGANARGFVKIRDDNSNPTLQPVQGLYVFHPSANTGGGGGGGGVIQPSEPAVLYEAPSTRAESAFPAGSGLSGSPTFGLISTARLFTRGNTGTAAMQLGTSSSNLNQMKSIPLTQSSESSFYFWTDWDEPEFADLQPGQRYYWRAGFKPQGSNTYRWGETQTFVGLRAESCGEAPITVSIENGEVPTEGDDVILGTPGDDTIVAGAGHDKVCALGGNDTIDGGAGNDYVQGDAGDDTITANDPGHDTTNGGTGNDTISYAGATGPVSVSLATTGTQNTGQGTDRILDVENLVGTDFGDTLIGSDVANRIIGGQGSDVITGRGGGDLLLPGAGTNVVDGDGGGIPGVDTVSYADLETPVTVTLLNIVGVPPGGGFGERVGNVENIVGGQGNDTLTGNNAVNSIRGGPGHDRIDGSGGHDKLYGDAGDDTVYGGDGDDYADGGAGNDKLYGGPDQDRVLGGDGNDTVSGGSGDDRVYGQAGNDRVSGDDGNDYVSGYTGNDTLSGGAGNDTMYGSSGNDVFSGSSGNDKLYGESGNDRLDASTGKDYCSGGTGTDTSYGCDTKTGIP